MLEEIRVSPGPHIGNSLSTKRVMLDVIIGLLPAMAAACYFFRLKAVAVLCVCIVGCIVPEIICNLIRKKKNSIGDLSAVVTGIILAFSLPASIPLWTAAIGSVFCIVIAKMVFGGLGSNVFNPAMVGRAFLAACFGALMTTWTVPATINPAMPELGTVITCASTEVKTLQDETVMAITQATPLAWIKDAIKEKVPAAKIYDQQLKAMCLGETAGCLGETSVIALLIGGVYLLIRKTITYHIPAAVLLGAIVFEFVGYMVNADRFVNPVVHLAGGGMMICAFFIATDPVTAPMTKKGMWVFGLGIGVLIMLIRTFGAYPEGVMYAVLLMNALTPLIDRFFRPIPVGGSR